MTVLVLTIWSPGAEVTTSLHATQAGAFLTLVQWVENIWTAGAVGCDLNSFASNADMVKHFFEMMSEDCQYDMSFKRVHGLKAGGLPELGPDEILLDPGEIRVTVHALKYAARGTMALAFDKSVQECHDMIQGITEKLES